MRAAIYLRVSTDEQAKEGFSIDAQRALLERKCTEWGYTVANIYNDEGYSAKNIKRPAIQQLIKDAENKYFDVVVYWRLDRLTRSSKDFHKLVEQLSYYDVGIKSATEQIDTTTAIGRFQLELSVSLAQLERETISERVTFVMQEGVRQGKWHGGPVSFGYTWDGDTMNIVEEEYETLRLLRDLYMQGNGFYTIAKNLNALGRLRKGFSWTSQSVSYVLDNPFYAGKIRYGTKKKNGKYSSRKKSEMVDCIWSDTNFPMIFTWEEYEEHTKRMTNRKFYGHARLGNYWFSGVIRCARCGSTMTGRPKKSTKNDGTEMKYSYYICGGRQNGSGCSMPMLRQELAEKLILDHIVNLKSTTELETKAAAKIKKEVVNHNNELNDLNKELNGVAERRKKFQYMFAEDLISEGDLKLRRREEDDKEKIIKNRIESLKSETMGTNPVTMNMMFDLLKLWPIMDDKDRNIIAQEIFKSVIVDCHDENPVGRKGQSLDFRIQKVNYN